MFRVTDWAYERLLSFVGPATSRDQTVSFLLDSCPIHIGKEHFLFVCKIDRVVKNFLTV